MPPSKSVRFIKSGSVYRCRNCQAHMAWGSVQHHAIERHGTEVVRVKEID